MTEEYRVVARRSADEVYPYDVDSGYTSYADAYDEFVALSTVLYPEMYVTIESCEWQVCQSYTPEFPEPVEALSTNASVEYEVGHQEIYERLDNIDDRLNILDEIETHLQVMNFVIDTVANNDPVFRDRLAKIEKALIETTGPTKESDISSDIRD